VFITGAIRRSRIICTVSDASRNDIVRLFQLPEERIRVIYHGVSPRYHAQSEADVTAFRKKHGLERPFFLFVGAWEPRKNLPRLIDAFRIFREEMNENYELVLVGPPGRNPTEVEHALQDPRIARYVRRLGFLADEEMPMTYAAAEAFVFPSLGEGFGLPMIEAMACGTPVIASGVSCLPEVAGDAALFINPEDSSDIARAMKLVTVPDVRHDLRDKGFRRAAIFTWESAAERAEETYLDALR